MPQTPTSDCLPTTWTARADTDAGAVRYVQVARGLRWVGRALMLVDLAPCTICMVPAAGRVGRLSTGAFLDEWAQTQAQARAGRAERGVPAVLSLMDAAAQLVGDAEVLLSEPTIYGDGLRYTADLRSGALPGASGACVLFINVSFADVGHGPPDPRHPGSAGRGERGRS